MPRKGEGFGGLNMRLEKKKFYQAKGFYICCFLALFAILSVVTVQKKLQEENKIVPEKVADLGEQEIDKMPNNAIENAMEEAEKVADNYVAQEDGKEEMVVTQTEEPVAKEEAEVVTTDPKSDVSIKEKEQEEIQTEEVSSVINPEEVENGLTWPIDGKILMPYSMDKSIYFSTLGQYKCNPALVIEGKEGDSVVSACDCVITKVSENPETGLTVVAEANNYKFIYGQLKDVSVKKGDSIQEGQVLGNLASPSKYYTNEGCNLYFQVKEDGENVNPLLLLK